MLTESLICFLLVNIQNNNLNSKTLKTSNRLAKCNVINPN